MTRASTWIATFLVTGSSAAACGSPAAPSGPPPSPAVVDEGSVTAASDSGCGLSVTPSSVTVTAEAQTVSIVITSNAIAACEWTARSESPFLSIVLSIASGASGKGTGRVTMAVEANGSQAPRTGTLTIAGQTVSITQLAPATCVSKLTLASTFFMAVGGTTTATVEAPATCTWRAFTAEGFVTVPSVTRNGPGSFSVAVAASTSTTARTASIGAGSKSVTIRQSALIAPPPAPAGEATFFTMHSEPGDFIGQGTTRVDVPPAVIFQANVVDRRIVQVTMAQPDGSEWRLTFAAPQGTTLTPGTYDNATGYPFQLPGGPAMSIRSPGRVCNQLSGRFVIHEAAFSGTRRVERFRATFEQHCNHQSPGLAGEIALVRPFGAPLPPPPPAPPAGATTYFTMLSQPGDYIGKGGTRIETQATAAFSATIDAGYRVIQVLIQPAAGGRIRVEFAAPAGKTLAPGTYVDADRYPFQPPDSPGMDFAMDGRGCNELDGRFVIHEAVFGSAGIVRFRATFEQHCEFAIPAAVGDISLTAPFTHPSAAPPALIAKPATIRRVPGRVQ